jgi:hypothetical protein
MNPDDPSALTPAERFQAIATILGFACPTTMMTVATPDAITASQEEGLLPQLA